MIQTKAEFYRLWRAGVLGNRPRTWATLVQLEASGYRGSVTIRSVGGAGGKTRYNVAFKDVALQAWGWPGTPTFNESAPDEVLTIQGEVMRGPGGLDLYYDCTPNTKMNEARLRFRRAQGLAAKLILDHFLWPSSRDDLEALLELYEDHVIEFGSYAIAVGDQPHRNTLIWEVRHY